MNLNIVLDKKYIYRFLLVILITIGLFLILDIEASKASCVGGRCNPDGSCTTTAVACPSLTNCDEMYCPPCVPSLCPSKLDCGTTQDLGCGQSCEGTYCASGTTCIDGDCYKCTPNCPSNLACGASQDDLCGGTCPEGNFCETGICVSGSCCTPLSCPSKLDCGTTQDLGCGQSCEGTYCASGTTCQNGSCVPGVGGGDTPCLSDNDCDMATQTCRSGKCITPTDSKICVFKVCSAAGECDPISYITPLSATCLPNTCSGTVCVGVHNCNTYACQYFNGVAKCIRNVYGTTASPCPPEGSPDCCAAISGGETKTCHWTVCSSDACVSRSGTYPVDVNCPENRCSVNNDCVGTGSGTATIVNLCGNNSAAVTAVVDGGNKPYKKYTWYKQIDRGTWAIDYEEICPVTSNISSCNNTHTYLLSGQIINAYLRVEDIRNNTWASNILNINCNKVCTDGDTQNCTTSSNCPGQQICANSTWGTCADIPNDGCPADGGCPVGQIKPHNTCSGDTCISVDSCGSSSCLIGSNDCDSVIPCSFTEDLSITPIGRIILLGSTFKASWDTTNCDNCTMSCNTTGCGKNLPDNNAGLTSDEYKITPEKAGSYSYTLTCRSAVNSVSQTLGRGVVGDKLFRVINFFWRETPAFLKLLIDKLF